MKKHGKKYRMLAEKIESGKEYQLSEAIDILKGNALAKFDESVEVHVRLNINPKKTDEQVRSTVVLPHGTGKGRRVAVVSGTAVKEAEAAGAVLAGGEEIIAKIKEGKVNPGADFDILLATPDMMPKLAMVAKILGPKGLMPSPKNETVTPKVAEAVEMLSKGKKASFKNDDGANIHQVIGKLSFESSALAENYASLFEVLSKAKPEGVKGKFVKSIVISTTMGPGLRIAA